MVSIWLKCNILYDPFYFFFQLVICQKIKKKMPGFDPATNDFFLSFFKIASKKLNPLFLTKSHSSLQSLPASVSLHVKCSKLFPVQWKGWDNKPQGLQITSRSSAGSSSSVSREPGTCGHLWERWRQEQEGPRAWTRRRLREVYPGNRHRLSHLYTRLSCLWAERPRCKLFWSLSKLSFWFEAELLLPRVGGGLVCEQSARRVLIFSLWHEPGGVGSVENCKVKTYC